jgi:cytidylate kinase
MTNILNAISAMAEVAAATAQGTLVQPKLPVITLSRDYGSGGDIIATRLCQRLDLPLYDDEILKALAQRMDEDPVVIRQLDEGFEQAKDMWLYRLFSGKEISPDAYRDTLIKLVMSLGRVGGLIVGRGAHVILAEACALRVRVTGSPEICAKRMAARGHGSYEAELEKAHDINHRRGQVVWDMFQSRLSDASQYDIVINTDRMDDFEDVVEMLVVMAKAVHSGRVLGLAQDDAA